jgi:hypothetical protein
MPPAGQNGAPLVHRRELFVRVGEKYDLMSFQVGASLLVLLFSVAQLNLASEIWIRIS